MLSLGRVESISLLQEYHDNYTCSCCPEMPDPVEPIAELERLTGTYPVVVDRYRSWREAASSKLYSWLSFPEDERAYKVVRLIKEDEFYSNILSKETFDAIKDLLSPTDIQLIKKSSPKVSNVILSIGKYVREHYPVFVEYWDKLEKDYNDRGTNKLDGYELLISTEPHRIAGMSAFGHYTSCQDWIEKDEYHEYHDYTHMSWANLNDPTIGVCCIRKSDDPEAKDMLARSLIRVMPLENGHVVVYLGRLYAHAPYDQYIKASLNAWAETLPANYHVINMFEGENPHGYQGQTASGQVISGCMWVSYDLDHKLTVYGTHRCQCDTCDGSGMVLDRQDCDCCDGTGRIEFEDDYGNVYGCTCKECNGDGEFEADEEIECPDCDGSGYVVDGEEDYKPYNDHGNWVNYYSDHIEYNVPCYILGYNDINEETTNNEAIAV